MQIQVLFFICEYNRWKSWGQTNRHRHKQRHGHKHTDTDTQTDKQTDTQTDTQTHGQRLLLRTPSDKPGVPKDRQRQYFCKS